MSKLTSSWETSIQQGKYQRKESQFRHWVTAKGETGFKAEAGRYHLYVSLACPWAHRTTIFRALKGLVPLISMSVVHPDMFGQGWTFEHDDDSKALYGTTGDTLNNFTLMREAYAQSDASYQGNITVPVLWDKQQQCIVNNESADIIRMFNSAFDGITGIAQDFYPKALRAQIDEVNAFVYHNINNGVYKTGFATTQAAHEQSSMALFAALDRLEQRLSKQRYLVGEQITEADWRLFTTLVRFDAVYHTHFKCNIQLIKEYDALYGYLLDLYQQGGIAETINMAHIKRHYYNSHRSFNPYGIVPLGHRQDWTVAHHRAAISAS